MLPVISENYLLCLPSLLLPKLFWVLKMVKFDCFYALQTFFECTVQSEVQCNNGHILFYSGRIPEGRIPEYLFGN